MDEALKWAERQANGGTHAAQLGLFGSGNGKNGDGRPQLPQVEEWVDMDKLRHERETLGFLLLVTPWINTQVACLA